MATKVKRNTPDILDETVKKNDWQQLVEQVRTYPVWYGSVAVFIVICILLGSLYHIRAAGRERAKTTQYVKALETEKAADRAAALQAFADKTSPLTAKALYMAGESFIESKEYDKAKESFEKLRSSFPNAPEIPNAVEALGFLLENKGDYEGALGLYKEVAEKWKASLASQHQGLNIGRCLEHLGKFEEADKAYSSFLETYPVLQDQVKSGFATEVQAAQEKLREAHPELAPKPKTENVEPAPAAAAPPAAAPAPPAPPAPPATPAPAPPAGQ